MLLCYFVTLTSKVPHDYADPTGMSTMIPRWSREWLRDGSGIVGVGGSDEPLSEFNSDVMDEKMKNERRLANA